MASSRPITILGAGRKGFGSNVSVRVSKTLSVNTDVAPVLQAACIALRDWFALAHRTGLRYDDGRLPRDQGGSSWVGYNTGALARGWQYTIEGSGPLAKARVALLPQDSGRALRIRALEKRGIKLAGLRGKARTIFHEAAREASGHLLRVV